MSDIQTINVTVPIPETHIIISRVEYQELIDNKPINMTLTEVAETYPATKAWIVDNIIKDDYFKER